MLLGVAALDDDDDDADDVAFMKPVSVCRDFMVGISLVATVEASVAYLEDAIRPVVGGSRGGAEGSSSGCKSCALGYTYI